MAQKTKQEIIACFFEMLNTQSFDKISIVSISERCGINRNTFYYYFEDIYAMLVEALDSVIASSDVGQKARSWEDAFLMSTEFGRKNRKVVYHLYYSNARERLEQFLYDLALSIMRPFVQAIPAAGKLEEGDRESIAIFCSSAIAAMMVKWLRSGMNGDAEEEISKFGRLMDHYVPIDTVRGES